VWSAAGLLLFYQATVATAVGLTLVALLAAVAVLLNRPLASGVADENRLDARALARAVASSAITVNGAVFLDASSFLVSGPRLPNRT
jgi:uncharacterized membrane protein